MVFGGKKLKEMKEWKILGLLYANIKISKVCDKGYMSVLFLL